MLYDLIKVAHVFSVMAWMAGLWYLPRLFVYHCTASAGDVLDQRLQLMERRLLRGIMLPAVLLVWITGLVLLLLGPWAQGWVHGKITLVVCLTLFHHLLSRWRKDFAHGRNRHSERFYRIMNEIPTVLVLGILVLVIMKPF